MFEEFYSLNKAPFSLNTDPVFLYQGETHKQVLTSLEYGLANQAGFLVVFGAMGTGKTMLVRCLLDQIEEKHTAGNLLNVQNNSFEELLENVLSVFKLQFTGKNQIEKSQLLQSFLANEFANNRRVLLVIDEAHVLSTEVFKQLRAFCNYNFENQHLMQMILTGRESLYEKVKQPKLQPFDQCTVIFNELKPISEKETRQYIQHRLEVAGGIKCGQIFTPDACGVVFKHTEGVPSLVNIICNFALDFGFANKQKVIYADTVAQVALLRNEELQMFKEEGILSVGCEQREIEGMQVEQGFKIDGTEEKHQDTSDAELDRALDFVDLLMDDHEDIIGPVGAQNESGDESCTGKSSLTYKVTENSTHQREPFFIDHGGSHEAEHGNVASITSEISVSSTFREKGQILAASSDAELDKVLDAIDSQPGDMRLKTDHVNSVADPEIDTVTGTNAESGLADVDDADISCAHDQQSFLIQNDSKEHVITAEEVESEFIKSSLIDADILFNQDDFKTEIFPVSVDEEFSYQKCSDQIKEQPYGLVVESVNEARKPVHFLWRILTLTRVKLSSFTHFLAVRKNKVAWMTFVFIVGCSFFLIFNYNRIYYEQKAASITQNVVKKTDSILGRVTNYYETYQDSVIATILGLFSMMQNNISEEERTVSILSDHSPAVQMEPVQLKNMQSTDEWEIVDIKADDITSNSLEQESIGELLDLARQQIEMKHLTTPVEDSAWNTYQQVLKIAPGHKQALAGITNIKNIYKRWAKFEIVKGDFEHAELLYRKVLKISPNEREVLETLTWFDDINKATGK